MKLKEMKLLAIAAIITVVMAACHSQKEITNADGTKTKAQEMSRKKVLDVPKKDAMMQGDTMKRDNK